jgi:hypothetical protein
MELVIEKRDESIDQWRYDILMMIALRYCVEEMQLQLTEVETIINIR